MDTWFSRRFGDAIYVSDGTLQQIETEFQQAFAEAGSPAEMAVFTRLESESRLHCDLVVYFSPAARAVASEFDGIACEKPARPGLDLFAGDAACWSVLFPEETHG